MEYITFYADILTAQHNGAQRIVIMDNIIHIVGAERRGIEIIFISSFGKFENQSDEKK